MTINEDFFDFRNQFFILQEDRGSFLHISIPGQIPNSPQMRTLYWTDPELGTKPKFISPKLKKQMKKELIEFLKSQRKSLKHLPQREIPGYKDNYSYDFQYATTSSLCRDERDIVYVRNDVQHHIRHALWLQIEEIIAEKKEKFSDIRIELPVFPKIVTDAFYREWYENNQREMRFLTKTLEKSDKTFIEKIEKEDCFLLKLKNHPFSNQPVQRVQLIPTEQKNTIRLNNEEYKLLKTSVLKRDARLLNSLTNRERHWFSRGHKTDEAENLHIHWIHWDLLNGPQTRKNALLVTSDIQMKYRLTVELPFLKYWENYETILSRKGKPVFIDIPVPMNCYRQKPIQKEHLKPQERRFINRQERHRLNLMTYQAGRTYGEG